MRNYILAGLLAILIPAAALAQSVQQGGQITPGHATSWTTTGVVQDAGTSTNPKLTTLGIQASGLSSFCINNGPATGAYSALCLGLNHSVANLTVTGFNGETAPPMVLPSLGGPLNLVGWTTAGRPSPPKNYAIGFNTDTSTLDVWNGSAWQNGSAFTGGAVPNPSVFASPLTIGATGNSLTITPVALAGQPINLTQSGTGGITTPAELFLTGAGTGLSVTNNAKVSGTIQAAGTANIANIQGAGTGFSPFIFSSGSDTNVNLTFGCKGTCTVLSNQIFQAPYFKSQGVTQTLSGSTPPTFLANINGGYTGSSTISGDTSINLMQLGSSSDVASIPNGAMQDLYIVHTVGAGFDGNRNGINIQIQDSANSTGTPTAPGFLGIATLPISSFNSGGVATNFGFGGNNGVGSYFGGNLGFRLNAGATFKTGATALELDAFVATGASLISKVGEQINNVATSAVRGLIEDYAFRIADQVSASSGWSVMMAVGSYGARWPGDASSYIFQAQSSENTGSWPANVAGAFDLNQAIVSNGACGTVRGNGSVECPEGGGFYWRNPGVQLLSSAAQVGYGSLGVDANGLALDTGYQQMAEAAGSIVVTAGGSNHTTGDVSCDIYGDCVVVTASGGVVTAISSVLTRGWQTSPPSNPVTFVSRTRIGSAFGSGLTLTLVWTPKHQIDIGLVDATAIGIGNSGSTITLAGTVTMPTSTTGAGTQTFVNSPCSGLTTEKWIPVHITGQTGTWNIPACQ
jgi:hypothetical protein